METIVYADSDHTGDYVDQKSTSGVCTFMGCCLTSWFAKKQTALAISMTKAEYVSARKACQQELWMKQALIDYDIRLEDVPIITLDNEEMEITTKINGKVKVVTDASVRRHLKLEDSDGISNLPTTEIFKQHALMGTLDNEEMEITTKINGKVKVVTDASVRRHLKLEDSDGISNLPTTEIFKQHALMGSNIATALICLATNRKFNFSKLIFDGMVKNLDSKTKFFYGKGSTVPVKSHHTATGAPSTSGPHLSPTPRSSIRHETKVPQSSSSPHTNVADEATSTGVDVRHRVVALETDLKQTKKVYGASCTKLIMKVKKLEKTVKTSQARRRAKLVVSDDEEDLEDPFKQGRKIDEINQDSDISLIQHDVEIQERYDQDIEFNLGFDVVNEVSTSEKEVSTAELVSTAGAVVTTASVDVSPASPTRRISTADDITMAETLVYTRRNAAKDKETLVYTRRNAAKDKAIMGLQEELDEEERQRMAKVHEAARSFIEEEWENIRARVEANEELTQRLQAEEKNKYSEVDQAKMLIDLINQRKRYVAAQKAEAKRNKPMTQAQ
nr:retrovirus-related Pol polyprotein from transposon TNT 1-94 [Tanacetum cinerariifolium]